MGIRRKGREAALLMLYQMDVSGVSADEAIRLFWASLGDDEETAQMREGLEFANQIVRGYGADAENVDRLIRGASHHWRIERMSRVDRNVLRLGAWELSALADVPRRVTLNEAVELAKRYGAEGSSSFVNGVLDRIANDLGKA